MAVRPNAPGSIAPGQMPPHLLINPVKSPLGQTPPLVKRLPSLVRETVCVILLTGRGIALILLIKHKEQHNSLQ